MAKLKDRITLGLLSGFLANIPKIAFSEYVYKKGIEKRRFSDMAAGVFVPKKIALSKKGFFFGLSHDFMLASALGVPLVYLLSLTGKDKWLLKGLLTGSMGFGVLRGLMANIGPGKTYPRELSSNVTMIIGSLIWGATAGGIATFLGKQTLYNPGPLNKSSEHLEEDKELTQKEDRVSEIRP